MLLCATSSLPSRKEPRSSRRWFALTLGVGGALLLSMTAPLPAEAKSPDPPPLTAQVIQALERDLQLSAGEARKRHISESMAPTVEKRLRTTLGAHFGGAWMPKHGGTLQIGITPGADKSAVRAQGAQPVEVRYNEDRLSQVKATLDRYAKVATGAVTGWYVDLPRNRVTVVTRPGGQETGRRLIAASSVPAAMVNVHVSTETPRTLYDVRGGDPYYIGQSRCSVGFSVVGGFLTAGHCASSVSDTLTGPNRVALGSWGGFSFPGNDFGWVRTNSNWTPRPEVRGLGAVTGSQEVVVGASVCRSGSTTGVHCGTVQAKNQTVNYRQGTVTGLTRTNACAEPGDSGGSWMSGSQAQGLTSGGSGNCTSGGTTYFQPVKAALARYGLSLLTPTSAGRPIGAFDEAVGNMGRSVALTGWTIDPDAPTVATDVHVYIDGPAGSGARGVDLGPAKIQRPDVAAAHPGAGAAHGFSTAIPDVAPGNHTLYVYAINKSGAGDNPLLATRTVRVPTAAPGTPFGSFDTATGRGGGAAQLTGWTIDPDAKTTPTPVHVYIDKWAGSGARGVDLGLANTVRPDVAAVHPGAGDRHGFNTTITGLSPGDHTLYVYAINIASTGDNPLLATRTITIPEG